MATISRRTWNKYIGDLRKISDKAAEEALKYIERNPIETPEQMRRFVDYCYGLATKYGEAAGSLACEMYDALAELSRVSVPSAVPAPTASYGDVAKAVYGTILQNPEITSSAIGRQVKLVGVDTMQQNALRDGAQWAWIPSGDTCAFCLTLASRGWQRASKNAIKNGHAEHVHANCDCTYCVRFGDSIDVEGYDPSEYLDMYKEADGSSPKSKINALRREFYAENKQSINEQKRSAYAKRMERESSEAEEVNVN